MAENKIIILPGNQLKEKKKQSGGQMKTTYQLFPESSNESKTLQYKQNNIHDFAWFADKRFIVNS